MDPYRPEHVPAPLARVEGNELLVSDGEQLPRACVLCGTRRKLVEAQHTLTWRPAAAPLLLFFGIFGRLLASATERTATLTYATCKPCLDRSRNRRDLLNGTIVGALVFALAAATVGLNGYPIIGVAIAIVGTALVVLFARSLGKGQLAVAYIHGDGTVHLRGVSSEVAKRAIENRKDAAGERLEDGA